MDFDFSLVVFVGGRLPSKSSQLISQLHKHTPHEHCPYGFVDEQ